MIKMVRLLLLNLLLTTLFSPLGERYNMHMAITEVMMQILELMKNVARNSAVITKVGEEEEEELLGKQDKHTGGSNICLSGFHLKPESLICRTANAIERRIKDPISNLISRFRLKVKVRGFLTIAYL